MKMLPVLHKPTETSQFFQDHDHSPHLYVPGAIDDGWSREDHLRPHEVTIRFLPITRDRMEIETRKWFQTTWLVKPLRKIRILTYLGHDLTFTWPCPDPWPEVRFWNWAFKVKKYMFRTGSTRRTRWCHFHCHIYLIQKVINGKLTRWKTIIFYLMTSGVKPIDLRSYLIGKFTWAWRELSNAFWILPSYYTYGDNSDCLRKNRYFIKIWSLVTYGDPNIDRTWKLP